MKTRLLKKLRKRYTIAENNGRFKVIIKDYKFNDIRPFDMTLDEAIERRRDNIIHYARNRYTIPE